MWTPSRGSCWTRIEAAVGRRSFLSTFPSSGASGPSLHWAGVWRSPSPSAILTAAIFAGDSQLKSFIVLMERCNAVDKTSLLWSSYIRKCIRKFLFRFPRSNQTDNGFHCINQKEIIKSVNCPNSHLVQSKLCFRRFTPNFWSCATFPLFLKWPFTLCLYHLFNFIISLLMFIWQSSEWKSLSFSLPIILITIN